MKPIELTFTKSQWHFEQLSRVGDIAIYKRKKNGDPHYEVVRIRRHNGFKLPTGEMTEPAEYYPGDNAWGTDGFTFVRLDVAQAMQAQMFDADQMKLEKKLAA
jgi:hypothetical protein